MDQANLNPLYVILLYILRCLVPLGLMLAVSYLLRRFGLIKEPPRPPKDWEESEEDRDASKGGLEHD